jgi:hypothetical protein
VLDRFAMLNGTLTIRWLIASTTLLMLIGASAANEQANCANAEIPHPSISTCPDFLGAGNKSGSVLSISGAIDNRPFKGLSKQQVANLVFYKIIKTTDVLEIVLDGKTTEEIYGHIRFGDYLELNNNEIDDQDHNIEVWHVERSHSIFNLTILSLSYESDIIGVLVEVKYGSCEGNAIPYYILVQWDEPLVPNGAANYSLTPPSGEQFGSNPYCATIIGVVRPLLGPVAAISRVRPERMLSNSK